MENDDDDEEDVFNNVNKRNVINDDELEQLKACGQQRNKTDEHLDKYLRCNCIKLYIKLPEDEVVEKKSLPV